MPDTPLHTRAVPPSPSTHLARTGSAVLARMGTLTLALACAAPGAVWAHPGDLHTLATSHSAIAGLMHPWSGADHWLAMLAVGLWSALVVPRQRSDRLGAPLGVSMKTPEGFASTSFPSPLFLCGCRSS